MRIQLLRSFVALTLLFVTSISSASPFGLSTVAAVVSTSSADSSSANSTNPKTFVFSAIPDQDEANLQERFDKVLHFVESSEECRLPYKESIHEDEKSLAYKFGTKQEKMEIQDPKYQQPEILENWAQFHNNLQSLKEDRLQEWCQYLNEFL